MSKATLFLDFDDVVNFFCSRTGYQKNKDAFGYLRRDSVYSGGLHYNMNWSSELVKKLNTMKNDYDVKWLWLTSWKDLIVNFVDPKLGSRSDGALDWFSDARTDLPKDVNADLDNRGKYAALLDSLRKDPMPFIWVDDSATVKYNKADFVGVLDVPHLVVTPDAKYGLLRSDHAAMVSFLDSLGD